MDLKSVNDKFEIWLDQTKDIIFNTAPSILFFFQTYFKSIEQNNQEMAHNYLWAVQFFLGLEWKALKSGW